jgi:phosphoenolpyruvate carboxykinase (GTP)
VPAPGTLDTEGLDLSADDLAALLEVDPGLWKAQLPQVHAHFARFGDDLPQELRDQLAELEQRLEGE